MKVLKKDTNKIYAMKIIHKTKISGQRQLQCLIAEKNIMLNDNPFLVHLHYSFQTDEKLYFVMDYISGGDLAYHLEQKGRFNEKEVRFIGAEIVLALAHLHSAAVIMRDMKLENILLDKEGHVCITDFVSEKTTIAILIYIGFEQGIREHFCHYKHCLRNSDLFMYVSFFIEKTNLNSS